mmetsp:Transcript_32116/g.108114  ORF Transcript_32116/g.108114 Transcript_32116/m.108114 type:complete len:252 (-) Transcript_32116:1906-2661(-)
MTKSTATRTHCRRPKPASAGTPSKTRKETGESKALATAAVSRAPRLARTTVGDPRLAARIRRCSASEASSPPSTKTSASAPDAHWSQTPSGHLASPTLESCAEETTAPTVNASSPKASRRIEASAGAESQQHAVTKSRCLAFDASMTARFNKSTVAPRSTAPLRQSTATRTRRQARPSSSRPREATPAATSPTPLPGRPSRATTSATLAFFATRVHGPPASFSTTAASARLANAASKASTGGAGVTAAGRS